MPTGKKEFFKTTYCKSLFIIKAFQVFGISFFSSIIKKLTLILKLIIFGIGFQILILNIQIFSITSITEVLRFIFNTDFIILVLILSIKIVNITGVIKLPKIMININIKILILEIIILEVLKFIVDFTTITVFFKILIFILDVPL